MYSLNELTSLIRKAALGVGLPEANADDLAAAGLWLAACGLPSCSILARALSGSFDCPIEFKQDKHEGRIANARVALAGPCAIELMRAKPTDFELVLEDLDEPSVLLGLAGASALRDGACWRLDMLEAQWTISSNTSEDDLRRAMPCGTGTVTLARYRSSVEPTYKQPRRDLPPRYDPSLLGDDGWEALQRLARQTLVPATELSRTKGAGAGLIDND